jgi:hypothetical protein
MLTARPCDARCVQAALSDTYAGMVNLSNFKYQSWYCQADQEEHCMSSISHESVSAIAQTSPEMFLRPKSNILSGGRQS